MDFINKKYYNPLDFKDQYINAQPYEHIIFDNFLSKDYAQTISAEFPDLAKKNNHLEFNKFDNKHESKFTSNDIKKFSPLIKNTISFFNGKEFLLYLKSLTGISENYISDPFLIGGGLHQIKNGGYLKLHTDFNYHPEFNLKRSLNMLIYLNDNWQENYGGALELWDKKLTKCYHKILPIMNRCVIFSTSSKSFHGHPKPLTIPPNRSRNSLAFYYYTGNRENLKKTNGKIKFIDTVFKYPCETKEKSNKLKKLLKILIPPIIIKILKNKGN